MNRRLRHHSRSDPADQSAATARGAHLEDGARRASLCLARCRTGMKEAPGLYRLIALRSNDQFNTTIYGYRDRMRGPEGTCEVLLIQAQRDAPRGPAEGPSGKPSSAMRRNLSEGES